MSGEERFSRIPLETLTKPRRCGLHDVYLDHWWAVDAQGRALFFKGLMGSPQCHVREAMAKRLADGAGVDTIRRVPMAFVPVSLSDCT